MQCIVHIFPGVEKKNVLDQQEEKLYERNVKNDNFYKKMINFSYDTRSLLGVFFLSANSQKSNEYYVFIRGVKPFGSKKKGKKEVSKFKL